MIKAAPPPTDMNKAKRRPVRSYPTKRALSASPIPARPKNTEVKKQGRRCQSLSPSNDTVKNLTQDITDSPSPETPLPEGTKPLNPHSSASTINENEVEKEVVLPQIVVSKIMRNLATKRREFLKMRKNLITQQNSLLEMYAQLKELEGRSGVCQEETLGEVRVLSVSTWPAHDLLMLVREDLEMPLTSEITGIFGPHVLQQLTAQLNPIPEEVLAMCAEVMARRIDLLNFLRAKHRGERSNYVTNLEWKAKNVEFDTETQKLHRMVVGSAENLKAKINCALELAKIPWVDRDALAKRCERVQKDNHMLQHKLDDITKKDSECNRPILPEGVNNYQELCDELNKEKAGREALKEVVTAAESMLRVARARIATLERQLKDNRNELEAAKKKHKDLEQLYRHRENSYDQRSRKLIEVSKNGEMTIESLSRQRDALEIRVKELLEQTTTAENMSSMREMEHRARADSWQAKATEQEKAKAAAEVRVVELEVRVKDLEEMLVGIRERSIQLADLDRNLDHVPAAESDPSDRETEIWKELQVARVSLARAEEEIRNSRADKDSFLNSLTRIAQGEGTESQQNKIAAELVEREQTIGKLQRVIQEHCDNEKMMEQSMAQYENQLAALRLEVRRLRNYDCYSKEVPHQQLQTELIDLHLQVDSLTRERTALVTAAASRALMLERHERSADMFSRVVRARRELAALLDRRHEAPQFNEADQAEATRSLSSVCSTAADTWSALRAERARVLRLESAVLSQSIQLEREGRVRTQLERRRAMLEREVLRASHSSSPTFISNNQSLIFNNDGTPNYTYSLEID